VAAFQGGAFEYLPKPFDVDQAVELIRRAIEESVRESGEAETPEATPEILGRRLQCRKCFVLSGAWRTRMPLCSSTANPAPERKLVARHCTGIARVPRSLSLAQYCGHSTRLAGIRTVRPRKGAFTGAQAMRRGRFEQADGGTLFLDEIGDMPPELQTRLLRVLSDGQFYRVGGHQPIKVNVRIIAATHQDLETGSKRVCSGKICFTGSM